MATSFGARVIAHENGAAVCRIRRRGAELVSPLADYATSPELARYEADRQRTQISVRRKFEVEQPDFGEAVHHAAPRRYWIMAWSVEFDQLVAEGNLQQNPP